MGNSVSGPGKSASTLDDGSSYLNVLGVRGNGRSGDLFYRYDMEGLLTDDKNYDIQRISMDRFNLSAVTGDHTLDVGDIHEILSPYTLTAPVKGASYKYLGGASPFIPEVALVFGEAAPRWDNLWGGAKTDILNRRVQGSRFQFNFAPPLSVGVDILDSKDTAPVHPWSTLYDNRVYAMDFRYRPLKGVVLAGASAFNDTTTRSADRQTRDNLDGTAMAIKTIGQKDRVRVLMEYERVTPDFKNPLDSATPDREKAKFSCRFKFDKNIHLYTNLLWYQDNLDGRKPLGQTDVYLAETALGFNRPFRRANGFIKFSYIKEIAERESLEIRHDDVINLNYRDQLWIVETDTNVGFNVYDYDQTAPLNKEEIRFNTRLHSVFGNDSIRLKPNLFLGGWTLADELSIHDNRATQYAMGMGIDLPVRGVTTDISLGINRIDRESGYDTTKSFGKVYVDWQPDFLFRLHQMILYFSGAVNDFDFSDANDNFREESLLAGIKIKY